ncbi:MAG: hypothetical protein LQ338_003452 [Usnochroma carphineum]|nr:MAG: hypothetical protein LQ338_003452 [Usnochroma carphineum]
MEENGLWFGLERIETTKGKEYSPEIHAKNVLHMHQCLCQSCSTEVWTDIRAEILKELKEQEMAKVSEEERQGLQGKLEVEVRAALVQQLEPQVTEQLLQEKRSTQYAENIMKIREAEERKAVVIVADMQAEFKQKHEAAEAALKQKYEAKWREEVERLGALQNPFA